MKTLYGILAIIVLYLLVIPVSWLLWIVSFIYSKLEKRAGIDLTKEGLKCQ